ncbi:aconitate hydratase AcnA [Marinivivus vitaminiproducens]|uniref:aconitate hydratase AcnA n=1 Tax=Marinivivus vitaminiproducens TaxID=3035935 RepID=UPI0027A2E438|nr:aconitate hydratase AcnA [Geminicoccaceae bacterium SCSIO 64248]
MRVTGNDSLGLRRTLPVGDLAYDYFSLEQAGARFGDVSRLPFSLKVLLENLIRWEDGRTVTPDQVEAAVDWLKTKSSTAEIAYRPARVLMQDFTGVPAVVDLAAMREAMVALGGDPQRINPLSPVDLVIDHSVQVDDFGRPTSFQANVEREYERNAERYAFLRWGAGAFDNFRVVPPGTGICHQVNLEYLSQVVWTAGEGNKQIAYPDTLVGTDSHTTMVNGLAVLGWGVGGIEAEAAMLGQPISMVIPEVIGFKLTGRLPEGATATDLVLTVVQMLRKKGVVGKFVEFYGTGLSNLPLADRATIGNMAPEYGATCGFFPVDDVTLGYLRLTSRAPERVALVEAYAKAQGLWRSDDTPDPVFTDTLELDLGDVVPSLAGPKRPQDRVVLSQAKDNFAEALPGLRGDTPADATVKLGATDHSMTHGDVVIAAITSCTNTSNPSLMLAAGLVARNARRKGLQPKPHVKTSFAPGSRVVTDYMEKAGLMEDMNAVGFDLVGYGCTTCIGNSGPLPDDVASAVEDGKLVVASVLSGNRNFEGRVHPQVKANYLASPPLCVAYSFLGTMLKDITTEPLGTGSDGQPVYLKDIWPSPKEVAEVVQASVTADMFASSYADVFKGDEHWASVGGSGGDSKTYAWDPDSTYVRRPPYFEGMDKEPKGVSPIKQARILALLGDSITTDHISPAGSIAKNSPAAKYLTDHGVQPVDFNSYGARRGNHEVMMRGTFANIRLRNEMVPGTEGGWTKHIPSGETMAIYDAAEKYQADGTPLIVIGGKEYGSGSSRDWAAKGPYLQGVKAVIAESFERIHRSNLVGMGILPLQFKDGQDRKSLKLDGSEVLDLEGLEDGIKPRMDVTCVITRADGSKETVTLLCRVDTLDEVDYYRHGGILHYVVRSLAETPAAGNA